MKALSIPLFLAGLSLASAQAATAPDPAVTKLLTQAQDAQIRGEAELALRMAQAAIVADPARTEAYVALGDIYARQGHVEYARSYYDLALEIDPQDAAALKAIAALGAPAKAAANTP
jgi:Tfp pilus assembly protein PilF